MNRDLACKFAHLQQVSFAFVPPPRTFHVDIEENDLKPLLDEIFSVDPITGMPKGDIQYFMSKDGNPQVKAFIENYLIRPRSVASMSDPKQVSDDLIAEMSRRSDESSTEYIERIGSIRDEAIEAFRKSQLDANTNPE